MTTTPNLYGFATKELAQDATIAYLLAWADPAYHESHPRLHTLGSELLRSLLQTQKVDLPQIETLCIETQVDRIDILVRINTDRDTNRIILLIEDKVGTKEHSNQIECYKKTVKKKYSGKYDRLVAVYLKTGNESKASLPDKGKCGRFLRRDLLDVLNGFQDTGNVIVDDFRAHLQGWEDETNRWKCASYNDWRYTERAREGFYAEIERRWIKRRWNDDCGWEYFANPAGGFLACWLGLEDIRTENGCATLYMQIHDATRLTVRLGAGKAWTKVRSSSMYQVLDALSKEASDGIRIEKAGAFKGGGAAAVANVTFDEQGPWFAVDLNGVVDMDATIERLSRLEKLLQKVATTTRLTEQGIVS